MIVIQAYDSLTKSLVLSGEALLIGTTIKGGLTGLFNNYF